VHPRPPDEVFNKKMASGKEREMTTRTFAKTALGSLVFALAMYGILALPGLVSDTASTVPLARHQDQRP
jgi:hypothetical protein